MGTTADKLNKILETKQAIKQAIVDKGVDVSDDTVFADYPGKIGAIMTEGADPYFEYLWNAITNNNTNYRYLFDSYAGTELDVSKFDTSNATNMEHMFWNCNQLTSLDVSNFDISNVTNMNYMFYQCNNLTSLDLSNWDTGNVKNMSNMFQGCKKLTTIGDVSNWDTSNVTTMYYMFQGCTTLSSININNWNISKVTSIGSMFNGCDGLTELDVSNWDISHITGTYDVGSFINSCDGLVDFYPPKNINADMNVGSTQLLSHDSLMRIINNLMTVTSTKKLTLGTKNREKLTDEELAIATNKGWTLA